MFLAMQSRNQQPREITTPVALAGTWRIRTVLAACGPKPLATSGGRRIPPSAPRSNSPTHRGDGIRSRPVTRTRLERRLGLLLLVTYAAVIILGAWRHEIRPAFLDTPVDAARALLHALGIPPGVAVFTADTDRVSDAKLVALCVEVRVVERGGRARRLYPDDGRRCPPAPPRLGAGGEEIALYRSLIVLRAAVAAYRTESASTAERHPELLAEWIVEHFRARARARGLDAERFALLWREWRWNYATGERNERSVALLTWWSDPARGFTLAWQPGAERLAAAWPVLEAP